MRKFLSAILLVFLFSAPCFAEDLYVRPAGGSYGAEDGSSYANAFDGFGDVVWGSGAGQLGAGDNLFIAGTHTAWTNSSPDYQLSVSGSGTSGNEISFKSCHTDYGASDDDPGIFAPSSSSCDASIVTNDNDYLIFQGLTFNTQGERGIWIASGSQYLYIRNCTISNRTKAAVFISGSNITVGGSADYANTMHTILGDTGAGTVILDGGASYVTITHNTMYNGVDGVVCDNGPDHVYVRYNKIYTMSENCIDFKGTTDGDMVGNECYDVRSQCLVLQPGERNLLIGNYLHDCGHRNYDSGQNARAAINLHPATGEGNEICNDNVIAYNLIVNNHGDGIELTDPDGEQISGNKIYNNTIFNNGLKTTPSADYYGIELSGAIDGNHEIKNNIIGNSDADSDDTQIVIGGSSDISAFDNNRYYYSGGTATISYDGTDRSLAWIKANTSWEASGSEGDPGFTDSGGGDWTLGTGSACIDAGANLGATYDDGLDEATLTSDWKGTWAQLDQDDYGSGWEIGCYVGAGCQPDQPTNSTPANAATGVSVNPTLTSNAYALPTGCSAETYPHTHSHWQMRTDSDSDGNCAEENWDVTPWEDEDTTTELESNDTFAVGLTNLTYYCWRVRYKNSLGYGEWSDATYFVTEELCDPDQPTMTAPTGTGISVDPTLTADSYAVPGGCSETHSASRWQIALSTDTGFAASPLPFDSGTDTVNLESIATGAGLAYSTAYIARVQYQNSVGWSEWSGTTSFTTEAAPASCIPNAPTADFPTTTSTIGDELITGGTDMEDAYWVSTNSPETNEQTTHDGQTDCRHLNDSTPSYGAFYYGPQDADIVSGDNYVFAYKLKIISGTIHAIVYGPAGSNTGGTDANISGVSSWTARTLLFESILTTDGAWPVFQNASNSSAAEFYIDEVSLKQAAVEVDSIAMTSSAFALPGGCDAEAKAHTKSQWQITLWNSGEPNWASAAYSSGDSDDLEAHTADPDPDLSYSTEYCYRVRHKNADGYSDWSAPVKFTSIADPAPPTGGCFMQGIFTGVLNPR